MSLLSWISVNFCLFCLIKELFFSGKIFERLTSTYRQKMGVSKEGSRKVSIKKRIFFVRGIFFVRERISSFLNGTLEFHLVERVTWKFHSIQVEGKESFLFCLNVQEEFTCHLIHLNSFWNYHVKSLKLFPTWYYHSTRSTTLFFTLRYFSLYKFKVVSNRLTFPFNSKFT